MATPKFAVGFCVGVAVWQLVDIIVHIVTNNAELWRIIGNVIYILAAGGAAAMLIKAPDFKTFAGALGIGLLIYFISFPIWMPVPLGHENNDEMYGPQHKAKQLQF